jgi:hypothetical protein
LQAALASTGPWTEISRLKVYYPGILQVPVGGDVIRKLAGYASWLRLNHTVVGSLSYGSGLTKAVEAVGTGGRAGDPQLAR